MDLATITSIFRSHCHEGYSLCDVEVCDKQYYLEECEVIREYKKRWQI